MLSIANTAAAALSLQSVGTCITCTEENKIYTSQLLWRKNVYVYIKILMQKRTTFYFIY